MLIVLSVLAPPDLRGASQVTIGEMCVAGGSGLTDPLVACFTGARSGAAFPSANGGVSGPVTEDGEVIGSQPGTIARGEVEVVHGRATHFASADIPTLPGPDLAIATTGSIWRDQITVSAPGLNGSAGTLTAAMSADVDVTELSALSASFSVSALVQWIGIITINSHGWFFSGTDLVSHVSGQPVDGPNYTGDPLGLLTAPQLSFVFGTPFELRVEGRLKVQASTPGPGTAEAAADGLFLWGGIAAVFDTNGLPVRGYSLSSASDFDWASAVPIPPALLLLSTALAVPLFRVRAYDRK